MSVFKRAKQGRLHRRNDRQSRRGAAAVEFAVVAPLLVSIVLGLIDVGQFINAGHVVSNASREGARIAARTTTDNESQVKSRVVSYLIEYFPNAPGGAIAAAVQVNVTDGNGGALPGGNLTSIAAGAPVRVEVVVPFDVVRWLDVPGDLIGQSLSTTTVMRRE